MRCRVLTPLNHDHEKFLPGDTVELKPADAETLIAQKVVEPENLPFSRATPQTAIKGR